MKLPGVIILLFLALGYPILADDRDWAAVEFKLGLEAFNSKNYRTALQYWKSNTRQGHVKLTFYIGVMYAKTLLT